MWYVLGSRVPYSTAEDGWQCCTKLTKIGLGSDVEKWIPLSHPLS